MRDPRGRTDPGARSDRTEGNSGAATRRADARLGRGSGRGNQTCCAQAMASMPRLKSGTPSITRATGHHTSRRPSDEPQGPSHEPQTLGWDYKVQHGIERPTHGIKPDTASKPVTASQDRCTAPAHPLQGIEPIGGPVSRPESPHDRRYSASPTCPNPARARGNPPARRSASDICGSARPDGPEP